MNSVRRELELKGGCHWHYDQIISGAAERRRSEMERVMSESVEMSYDPRERVKAGSARVTGSREEEEEGPPLTWRMFEALFVMTRT